MAVRARLNAPKPVAKEWPWHKAKTGSLSVSLLLSGDRRMEAENYLASGFGTRLAIEAKKDGWVKLQEIARTWQPSRLKGIQVSAEFGIPFLAATQVTDLRPVPRKWLSLDRTDQSRDRFVQVGTILLTCSGNVGRATLAHDTISGMLVSHDLLRIEPARTDWWGWIYAYLRAPQVREMMKAAQYGHIIKHLEVSHLDSMPIISVDAAVRSRFQKNAARVLELRNKALEKAREAEALFEGAIGLEDNPGEDNDVFITKASDIFGEPRRRMDAAHHVPYVRTLLTRLRARGRSIQTLESLGFRAWLPNRFKRVPASDGVDLLTSSDFFEINPDQGRHIADGDFGDTNRGRVREGWMVVSRSGQVYGLLGSIAMVTKAHEDKVASDDLIRIAPGPSTQVRSGYVYVALSHPKLGRPILKALAYGSSIPHIEPSDLSAVPIVRLDETIEAAIADAADEMARLRAEADILENTLAAAAGKIIDQFIGS